MERNTKEMEMRCWLINVIFFYKKKVQISKIQRTTLMADNLKFMSDPFTKQKTITHHDFNELEIFCISDSANVVKEDGKLREINGE
jgi:hypothetical protein